MIPEKIEIKYLRDNPHSLQYATPGSAALDCRSAFDQTIYLQAQETFKVPLGFALNIQNKKMAGLLLPRSGLGSSGLVLANLIGLIDSDYQGEVHAVVWNRNEPGNPPIAIKPGDRICQLLFIDIAIPALISVSQFEQSLRGEQGFGSTGTA